MGWDGMVRWWGSSTGGMREGFRVVRKGEVIVDVVLGR